METPLPKAFRERIIAEWGDDSAAILEGLELEAKTSVLLHPNTDRAIFNDLDPVPWSPSGRILAQRPIFPKDPLWHCGAYYVQDASSMFLDRVLSELGHTEDPEIVLDLCAAPGGKSMIIQNHQRERDLLVSNEVHSGRNAILRENVFKWGMGRTIITQSYAEDFNRCGQQFDKVLIDAPCSGEGMFRKDEVARKEWNPGLVDKCARRQEDILDQISECVKPGGYLIYSTCTFAFEEDEKQVARLLERGEWESIAIPIKDEWGVLEVREAEFFAYRFFPGRIMTGEGLFLSVLKRKSDAEQTSPRKKKKFRSEIARSAATDLYARGNEGNEIWTFRDQIYFASEALIQLAQILESSVRIKSPGIPYGTEKGRDIIPHHAMALYRNSQANRHIEIDREQAIEYLKKGNVTALPQREKGWYIARYNGMSLGWMKSLGNRWNNYYPKQLRMF